MQQDTEQEIGRDGNALESALKSLWERARAASELIRALREERRLLQAKVEELEASVTRARNESLVRDVEVEQLRGAVRKMEEEGSAALVMTEEERKQLRERISRLLERIEARLSA